MEFVIDKNVLKTLNRKTAERLRADDEGLRRTALSGAAPGRVPKNNEGALMTVHVNLVGSHMIDPSKTTQFTTKDIRDGLKKAKKLISAHGDSDAIRFQD